MLLFSSNIRHCLCTDTEILQVWLAKQTLSSKLYQTILDQSGVIQHLLLMGDRFVVPKSMQKETLPTIHSGHLGIQRSELRARQSVWWPGISRDIEAEVKECSRLASKPRKPMIMKFSSTHRKTSAQTCSR